MKDQEATIWRFNIMRDVGGEFWKLPKVEAWRSERGYYYFRVGWRWTAWVFAYAREEVNDEYTEH